MKKRLGILFSFLVLVVVITNVWAINPPIGTSISTAEYVPVTLPVGWSSTAYCITTADGSGYYIASKPDGSDGELFPEAYQLCIDEQVRAVSGGGVLCYVKGTTSTKIVGLFKGYK